MNMRRFLFFALALLCLVGCSDDFRGYRYSGGFTKGNDFYPLDANFYPSADGCDLFVISQTKAGEKVMLSRFIVKVTKDEIKIIDGLDGPPEVRILLNDGTVYSHKASIIHLVRGTTITVSDYPSLETGRVEFDCFFDRKEKGAFNLYDKRKRH